jgi:putative oxidoreductase
VEQQGLLACIRASVDVEPVYLGRRDSAPQSVPLPDIAVWVSGAIHVLGGLALLVGFKTRWAAGLLALVCLGTAFGVHLPVGDLGNMIHFYKNLVMAGGFLYVIVYGAGGLSIDKEAA